MTDWSSNTSYRIGDDVFGPDNRLYNCIEAHTSTTDFELDKCERQGGLDQSDVDVFEEILNTPLSSSYTASNYS